MNLLYYILLFYLLTCGCVDVGVADAFSLFGGRGRGRGGGGGSGRGGFIHSSSFFGGDDGRGNDYSSSSSLPSAVISLNQEGNNNDNDKDNNVVENGILTIRLLLLQEDHHHDNNMDAADALLRGGGGDGGINGYGDFDFDVDVGGGGATGGGRYSSSASASSSSSTPKINIDKKPPPQVAAGSVRTTTATTTTTANDDVTTLTNNIPRRLIPFIKILNDITFWNDSLQQFRKKFTVRYIKNQVLGLGDGGDYFGDAAVPDEIREMKQSSDDGLDDEIISIYGYSHSWRIPHPEKKVSALKLLEGIPTLVTGAVSRCNTIFSNEENAVQGGLLLGPVYKTINNNNKDRKSNNSGGDNRNRGFIAIQTYVLGGILHGRTYSMDDNDIDSWWEDISEHNQKNTYRPFGTAEVDVTYCAVLGGNGNDDEEETATTTTSAAFLETEAATPPQLPGIANRPYVTIQQSTRWGTKLQPRDNGNCFGLLSRIRDYKEESTYDMTGSKYWDYRNVPPVSSYVKGAITLRIPTSSIIRRSSVLCFADWSTSKSCRRLHTKIMSNNNINDNKNHDDEGSNDKTTTPASILHRGSIGCGLNLVPFKFRISYTQNGDFGMSFGLTAVY